MNQKSKRGSNRTREDARHNPLRPFFLRIYRKGKGNNDKSHKAKKTRQRAGKQAKQEAKQESRTRGQEDKQGKQEQKDKKEDKREDKIGANTPQALKPPNYTRTQKPHKPRKAPKQHKPTPNI